MRSEVNVYIMTGFTGSGKSFWASQKAKNANTVIISRDSLRTMIKGRYAYNTAYEPVLRKIAAYSCKSALLAGFDVIIDELNLTSKARKGWLDVVFKSVYAKDIRIKANYVWCLENEHNVEEYNYFNQIEKRTFQVKNMF